MVIQKLPLIIFSLLLVLVAGINALIWENTVTGSIFGVLYLLLFGFIIGNILFTKKDTFTKLILGSFIFIALLMFIGSLAYILFDFPKPIPLIILALTPLVLLYYSPALSFNFESTIRRITPFDFFTLLYLLGAGTLFSKLLSNITIEATRSPWDILPTQYLFAFSLLTIFWIVTLIGNKRPWLTALLGSVHTFLIISVGVILFPIGFGYDPLLHEATEKILFDTGSISPKTILYIGQYVFVILIRYLTIIPITFINSFLLPVLFSLFIPSILLISLGEYFNTTISRIAIAIPFLLLLPLSQFTTTTPQGLSYLFLIIISFWWVLYNKTKNNTHLFIVIFLCITALFIHPLTGIPLILWIGSLFVIDNVLIFWKIRAKQSVLTGILLLSSLVLPMVFLLNNAASNSLTLTLRLPSFKEVGFTNLWHIESGLFTGQFSTFFDILYLYRFNWTLLFLIVFLIGVTLIKKGRLQENRHLIIGFGITWLSSVWLTLFFSFSELISYEQSDFPYRLFLLSLYFVIPIFTATLFYFWKTIQNKLYEKSVFILLLSLFITSVAFISYPRYDSYERIRSFTTSIHDINAVTLINRMSDGKPYVVLANQSVSAAAVSQFGFKQYYNGHFFYPIPTGGPLYEIYLSLVYEQPLKKTVRNAAILTGVNTVYFVLNDYWFNAEVISEEAYLTADSIEMVDNGKITIFIYTFK